MKRLLLLSCVLGMSSFCLAQTKKLQVEEDGFKWYKITDGSYCGAETTNGDLVIPLSRQYCDIIYESYGGGICYFNVITGCSAQLISGKVGVCDIFGKEIIPPSYDREKYICFVYATPDEKVNGCTGLHLVDYKDSNYPATIFHINIDSNGKAYRMSNGTKNYISDGKYASSGGGSSSSTSYDYVFTFDAFDKDSKRVNEKATIKISRSGNIYIQYGSNTYQFKCKGVYSSKPSDLEKSLYVLSTLGLGSEYDLPSYIRFYNDKDEIMMKDDGVLEWEINNVGKFSTHYTGGSDEKKAVLDTYYKIIEDVKNNTFLK